MVLFENLKVGSRVQTNWNGNILKGTVRYKGELITREGDWVGVELDEPVGDTSGLFKGRRYFQCNARHGVFIQPRRLHLLGNWRTTSANHYRTINKQPFADETLFARKNGETPKAQSWQDPVVISPEYAKATQGFSGPLTSNIVLDKNINFHKKHLVSNRLPCATSHSQQSVTSRFDKNSKQSAKHLDTYVPSSPSIPNIHVPRTVLKRMVERQYFGTSLPRHTTIY